MDPKGVKGAEKREKMVFPGLALCPHGAARLENMVATCLLRACFAMTDMGHGRYELYYIRTLGKKEIDFLVVRDHRPILAVEVKSSETTPSRALINRHEWSFETPTLGVQVADKRGVLQKHEENTWVLSVERFLRLLV
jgi:predicted AAA+ superfamily ATPase